MLGNKALSENWLSGIGKYEVIRQGGAHIHQTTKLLVGAHARLQLTTYYQRLGLQL
ncbi:MAG: hypothetical protein ACJATR_000893 [Halopseudomonas sp.]|jgi:hypothetical protein